VAVAEERDSIVRACGTTIVPRVWAEGRHGVDAWVELGSITKTVTATLLQRLAQEGRLEVDDPLEAWLPECPAGTGITPRMLANHTSGLPRLPPGVHFLSRDPYRRFTREALLALLPRTPQLLTAPPGAAAEYSNLGYAVLGLALERAAGAGWFEAATAYVLEPVLAVPFQMSPRGPVALAAGRSRPVRPWTADGAIAPAGGLWGTTASLYEYTHRLLAERVFGEPALGWRRDGDVVWHNGAMRASAAFAGHDTVRGVTAVAHGVDVAPDDVDRRGAALLAGPVPPGG
jgi:D-alanyl-D-alanine-carboxypeptidase/D-alanyl-D-alanine-endopeptidase